LKNQERKKADVDLFYIQINDVIASIEDIHDFFYSHHGGNEQRIAVIHADRNTPINYLNQVTEKILSTGYIRKNIYHTKIDEEKMTLGLVRYEY
jgi:hypothetical protein